MELKFALLSDHPTLGSHGVFVVESRHASFKAAFKAGGKLQPRSGYIRTKIIRIGDETPAKGDDIDKAWLVESGAEWAVSERSNVGYYEIK